MDYPDEAPELVEEGLGICPVPIVPHWGRQSLAGACAEIGALLTSTPGFIALADGQAVQIRDGELSVLLQPEDPSWRASDD